MKLKIIWSKFAEFQLDEIYEYYKKEAGKRIAKKVLKDIINEPNKLINSSEIGQVEDLLKDREISYRYFICNHYKIIYSIDLENKFIKIADVFDTRQNPPKIKRSK
jgi:plasmid stabilization system protein ParE